MDLCTYFVSLVLNPEDPLYKEIKACITSVYEDHLWDEDAIVLERNSRDFIERIKKVNGNAETLCDFLNAHPKGKFEQTIMTSFRFPFKLRSTTNLLS